MNNRLKYILGAVAATLLTACGGSDRFTIKAEIEGIGQQSVTMTYYADGGVQQQELVAGDKGELTFTGSAMEPTVAELSLTGSGDVLALVPVKNGEKIKVQFPISNPLDIKISGYKEASLMADFIRENAEVISRSDFATLNALIKDFVVEHPKNIASTCLLVTRFELEGSETLADSLFNIIDEKARPMNLIENFRAILSFRSTNAQTQPVRTMTLAGIRDSIYTYTPNKQGYTLLAFTGAKGPGSDSINRVLRSLNADYKPASVRVLEISLFPDSAQWRRNAKSDSARWDRAWVPGSAAAQAIQLLHVTRTPYFIVSDSTGRQLYRTPYPTNAARFIRNRR